ncbi:MAG: helix-turn-helix domain-containing protein [Moraxellaceae bacterium]|nr:helix-turn-helix domain-containing protein [Moraxellaceae bacterium]
MNQQEKAVVSTMSIFPLLKCAQAEGIAIQDILEGTALTESLLTDPDKLVLFSEELIVLKQYLRLTQQKLPGLYASQYYHYNSFGVLGAALASHANILDALNFIQKYIDLTFTPFKIIMQEQEDNLCGFYLNRYGLTGDCLEFYLLRDLAFLRNMTKDMLPDSWQDLGVSIDIALDMADLEKQQILAQFFYWPIRFGCRQSAIYGNKTKLNIPIHLGNEITLKIMQQQCEALLAKRKQYRWNNRVEDILLSSERLLSQEKVAKMLCCSERTLRRHLQQEGYNFADIVQSLQLRRAKDLLSLTQLSIKEIALNLGYSETAAFAHAFKRWTGQTPTELRRVL